MNAADIKPRFDWTIQAGHVLQAVAMVGGLFAATAYASSTLSTLEQRMVAQERLATRYVPVIDSLTSSNQVQDNRIANMAESIAQTRQLNTELLSAMGAVRESLAELKVRAYYQDRAQQGLPIPIPPSSSSPH